MAQQINLYDPALRLRRDLLTLPVLLAAVFASMLVVATGALVMQGQVQRLQAQAREVESTLQRQQAVLQQFAADADALRPDPGLVADLGITKVTLEHRLSALRMLRAGRFGRQDGHGEALLGIARQSVGGLWLTGLVLDGKDMALRGRALNPALIPVYIGRLNDEPALQGRSFRALNIDRPAEEAAASAPASAPSAESAAPFVEFSLTGSGGAALSGKEAAR